MSQESFADHARRISERGAELQRLTDAADQARAALRDDIVAALKVQMPQRDIADAAGYTREIIRRIRESAGIAPYPRSGHRSPNAK